MLDLFNELMQAFALFVSKLFQLEFVGGVSIGWMLVAISIIGLVIYFLFGRMR